MTNLITFRDGLSLTELQLHDFDVRGAVLIGSKRAIVWDTLSHPRDMAAVAALVADHEHAVVYSHADWDHCWGTAGLPKRQTVIAHSHCRRRFESECAATLREKQAAEPGAWEEVELIPPTRVLQESLSLDLGGCILELYHLPGHTSDCLVGFIPEWGILLAGDTVETPLPVVNAESPLPQWIAGLQRWVDDARVQTVIPAHGVIGGREIIQTNLSYLHSLLAGSAGDAAPDWPAFYRDTHRENLRHAFKFFN